MSKERHTVELADGRRVKFTVAHRSGEPHYFVYFRGLNGRRLERSTKEDSRKRAVEAAVQIIKEEYNPRPSGEGVTWDEATAAMVRAMKANNNRPSTIEDYLDTIKILRRFFPASRGPGDITPKLAKEFKAEYLDRKYTRRKPKPVPPPAQPGQGKRRGPKPKPRPEPVAHTRKPRTLEARIRKLRVIWGRWFIKESEYLKENPWEAVALPKLEKLSPRYLKAEEITAFFNWLSARWQGWRLPVLFFTVKSFLGNRILELCCLRSEQLEEGRIVFPADKVKGRKERKALLPPDVYAELKALAGPTFVWEVFPAQLLERLKALGKPCRNVKPDFSPSRLKWWLQDEIADYCEAHPEVKRFSAHAFRKRAMTEAWRLDISLDKAAVAFGCNPSTMRAHYIAMEETEVADEVLSAIAGAVKPVAVSNGQPPASAAPDQKAAGQQP
jgi:integrase